MTKKQNNRVTHIRTRTRKKHTALLTNTSANASGSSLSFKPFESELEALFKKKRINFEQTTVDLEKDILKSLKQAVQNVHTRPQDDFYAYINDSWLKNFDVRPDQKYIVQVDDFRLVQDKVYRELIAIVEERIRARPRTRIETQLSHFYKACKQFNTHTQTKYYADYFVSRVDELRSQKGNLWQLMGFLNYNEIISSGAPFVWSLNPDDKHPDIYRCYVDAPQPTLIDIDIYFEPDKNAYSKKYKQTYMKYLHDIFESTFGKHHGYHVEDIFECECKILNAYDCALALDLDLDRSSSSSSKKKNSNKTSSEGNYNIISKKDALKQFGFDWEAFAAALGFTYTPEFFITSNVNYLLCMTHLLTREWDDAKWRTYWVFLYIKQCQRFNVDGRETFYAFHNKFVRGQEELVDAAVIPVFAVGFAFNTLLTNEYIARNTNASLIDYVKTLSTDLKVVFARIIRRNTWMQPSTKKMALLKLSQMKLLVGSPKLLREDPILDYVDDDLWGNLVKISVWRHENAVLLEGKHKIDMPVIDWTQAPPKFIGTQAYVVNASYTPSENCVYIPLGYVQKPFIDLEERGIEYNLAHIGFTIAHEMSHALDDWGSQYDDSGKLRNWWTAKDRRKFKAIQDDVIKQYEAFALMDGVVFDAAPSVGEDMADISGLAICREYLRDFQLKNNDNLAIQKLSFESFFVYFAVQQRQQLSKKALNAQLKTNPHPPDKYRCNVPLSRIPVFRAIFDVVKGDKMWWHSSNRIWES